MRYRWFLNIGLLALCLCVAPKSFGQSTVTCNSDDEKRHSCAADTRGGVRLQSQQSGSPCTEGYSWGYNDQGIWVDHGCRALFAVGGRPGYQNRDNQDRDNQDRENRNRDDQNRDNRDRGYGNNGYGQIQVVTCNSDDEKRHYCATDTRGGVQLQTQQSGSPCTEGYSWGYDSQRIWVDHGCRGSFAVGGSNRNRDYGNGGYGNSGNGQAQTVTCNSDDEKKHYCAADTRGGVQLQNQRSGSPCTEGYSWGYDSQRIWVDHGCRATFTVRSRTRQRRR
ncbi:MAG TPA: DUF3011 domain-containing protein [Candidatus Dormibacteraeota bacterium]|nr:DUF3011 domain-containing protein [Candidatus Dormibacteraeota bacterium]